ncbi:MAG: SDR family oxidoreductase [Cyanobacteria bacterium J06576_12]
MRLNQKVALVTSSRTGVCSNTALLLAEAGASVMICGRNATQGQATVDEIQRSGGRASFVLADIASAADVQAAIDETIATYGRLDILFNCASGYYDYDRSLLTVSEAAWDRIVEVTLKGTFFCCQSALPFLQNAGSGVIINLIEQAETPESYAVNGICHGGIVSLTQAIAQQFSNAQVATNLIVLSPHPAVGTSPVLLPPAAQQILYAPLSAPADAAFSGIAEAIMYLADCVDQVHGHTLVVRASLTSAPPPPLP